MTQILSVITTEYALLASDRLLTYADGPRQGQVFDDDTCKLVSLCNICGIGYSGLANLGDSPTHEWIAKTLATAKCHDAAHASRILVESAPIALQRYPQGLRRQIFLIAGWAQFDKPPGLRSHFCIVTNILDASGQIVAVPRDSFDCRVRALHDNEQFLWYSIGQPLRTERVTRLDRNLRRLVYREIGPKEALRLLVDEIMNTHFNEKNTSVGNKILGFCIPRKSVEVQLKTGHSAALAKLPDENSVAFTYFDPTYSELRQYGPTIICGEFAATDIETENDPSRDFQSSQMRILSLPKSKV